MTISGSLQRKLLVVMLLTTLTAVVLALGAMSAHALRAYHQGWLRILGTQADLLGHTVAPALAFDDAKVARENLDTLKYQPLIESAAVYNARGALFATYASPTATKAFPPLPEGDALRVEDRHVIIFKRIVDKGEILGTLYLSADYGFRERIYEYAGLSLAVAAAVMLFAYFFAKRLQRVITRPILAITDIAEDIVRRQDYSRRAPKTSDDEVGRLVESFNRMLDEIDRRARALEAANARLAAEVEERIHQQEEISRLNAELESRVAQRTSQLEVANKELEAFCYSVSHDLRAPLRAIDGYSQALVEDFPQAIPEDGRRYLSRIRAATQRMGQLIEDLLNLSKVSRGKLVFEDVDLTTLAMQVANELKQREPERAVEVVVWENMTAYGDRRLLLVALENLISNAWKFTSRTTHARIEVGAIRDGSQTTFFVRDNGAGFDMAYADKLFGAFQRLHSMDEFQGTGIGLATVQRIVHRHGGRIWADARVDGGATFFFTLPLPRDAEHNAEPPPTDNAAFGRLP